MYRIEYSREAIDHLRNLSARERSIIFDAVDEQLLYEPTVETRNRKLMRPNSLAIYELRVGDLRVYYDIEDDPETTVVIRAVGYKKGNVVYISGEQVEL
ncbi:MAG: type II toxin-antitoxin system RelE/ParE family toxin [Anaerolineae bacterium]|nr:type II toxin-antitoxin system RelE/ParE family toxin [Anaerolineae bacterium]